MPSPPAPSPPANTSDKTFLRKNLQSKDGEAELHQRWHAKHDIKTQF